MDVIKWLLNGDVSIQYQTYLDLLGENKLELKKRISSEGFGRRLLDLQQEDGHWGGGYYHYKWINTHYTLLELRRLNCSPNKDIMNICNIILDEHKTNDGGISTNPKNWEFCDICINGMDLFYMCYFGVKQVKLESVVDFIVSQQLSDGGFNCDYNYHGAKHSSLHTTVSMIEGFNSYIDYGYTYKLDEVVKLREEAIEFILVHKLYISDRTGEIINKSFTMLSYPPRWKFDILRCLEAFMKAKTPFDERMNDAFELLDKKRRKDGTWPVQAKHAGRVHFDMEQTGKSSRWNTLRALRVLKFYFPRSKTYDFQL